MKLVVESLEELFELKLPGKNVNDVLNSDEFKNLNPDEMLEQSATNGFKAGVKKALDRGADIHADNDYALRWAARAGHKDVVELLLNRGADVHARNDWTLRWAAERGHKDVVELLLDRGANVNEYYALLLAANNGHKDIVELLNNWLNKNNE